MLPVDVVANDPGHPASHNLLHARYNQGAGASVDVGIRYVHEDGSDLANGLSWETAKATVSEATGDLGGSGRVEVAGLIVDQGIVWRQGQVIEGLSSSGVSAIRLADGADQSLFISDPNLTSNEFLHWAAIKNLRLEGNKANNTVGHAIEINHRVGEGTLLENLVIVDTAGDAIRANRGGQPLLWRDLHIFRAEGYGVSLRRSGIDLWQSAVLNMLSGDGNRDGLLHVKGAGDRVKESITVFGIKPEKTADGLQMDAVVLEDTTCIVSIIGGSTTHVGSAGNSFVKIIGATAGHHIVLQGVACGWPKWIDDTVAGVTVPRFDSFEELALLYYQRGAVVFRLSGSARPPSFGPSGFSLVDGAAEPATVAGYATVFVGSDGDLKVKFGDGVVKVIAVDT